MFGHHRSMLDGIQHRLGGAGQAMRIDGSTSMELRKKGMDDFQQKPSVRLAILSITAAGVSHDGSHSWAVCMKCVIAYYHWCEEDYQVLILAKSSRLTSHCIGC